MQTYSNSNSKLIPQGIALLLSADTLSNLFLIPVVVPSPSNTITTSSRSSNTLQATEFKKALAFTLQWEGGYSNHINDLGGKTFKGITQAKAKEYGVLDPRHLSDTQIHQIYQRSYWDAQKCWQYLPPLNYVCFDTAVNFGQFNPTFRRYLSRFNDRKIVKTLA